MGENEPWKPQELGEEKPSGYRKEKMFLSCATNPYRSLSMKILMPGFLSRVEPPLGAETLKDIVRHVKFLLSFILFIIEEESVFASMAVVTSE